VSYYLQDKRQYVGNCVLWYRKNGAGYTCNLNEAEIFSSEDADWFVNQSPEKYIKRDKKGMDDIATMHVDMQKLRR